ncbi:MAG: caspase family protein [Bacteroidales bacterium]
MKVSILVTICFLLSTFTSSSQDRGIKVISNENKNPGIIRALLIGVSDYPNLPFANQLQFADDDAIALYQLLTSHPKVKKDNILLLINSDANQARVYDEFNRMKSNAALGDLVILYFAGHGDVSRKMEVEDGFLLLSGAYSDKDGDYFENDVLRLSDLKAFIGEFEKNGVNILLITDACRSGKVLDADGSSKTLSALLQEWKNTAKIASCQPNELSQEGPQWGGGHGVFTYFLLKGLEGISDTDANGIVNLVELYTDVKKEVTSATFDKMLKRPSQTPKYAGDDYFKILEIDSLSRLLAVNSWNLKSELAFNVNSYRASRSLDTLPVSGALLNYLKIYQDVIDKRRLLLPIYLPVPFEGITLTDGKELNIGKSQFNLVSFSKDGNYFATASTGNIGILKPNPNSLWDYRKMEVVDDFKGNQGGTQCIAFANNTPVIAMGGYDDKILLHNIANQVDEEIKLKTRNNFHLLFSKDDSRLIVGNYNKNIDIIDISSRKKIKTLSAHKSAINCIQLSPDGNILASAAKDKILCLWNGNTFNNIKTIHFDDFNVNAVAFNRDSKSLYFLNDKNELCSIGFDNYKTEVLYSFNKDINRLYDKLVLTADGKYLFLGGNGYVGFCFFELANRKPLTLDAFATGKKYSRVIEYGASSNVLIDVKQGGAGFTVSKVTTPLPYATELFEFINNLELDSVIRTRIQSILLIAVQQNVLDITIPFIIGKDILPSIGQIKEAIRQLDYIEPLYSNDSVLGAQIKTRKLFLQGMEILASNDSKNYDQAVLYFNEILKLKPESTYPLNAISIVQKKQNDLTLAKQTLNTSIVKIPKWSEPKSNLGKTLIREGNYEKAIVEFNKIISINPGVSKGYSAMGDVNLLLGKTTAAELNYRQALKCDSANPSLYLRLGKLQQKRGRFAEAINYYNLASKYAGGKYTDASVSLCELYLNLFQDHNRDTTYIDKAFAFALSASQGDTLQPDAINSFVHAIIIGVEFMGADGFAARTLKLNPGVFGSNTNNWLSFFNILIRKTGNYSISLDPYLEESSYLLALWELVALNDASNAIAWLNKCKDKYEAYPIVFYNIGRTYYRLHDWKNTLQALEKAISIDPFYLPAIKLLMLTYSKQGDESKLNKLTSKSSQAFGETAEYRHSLSQAYFYLDKKDKAKNEALAAVKADTSFAYGYTLLRNLEGKDRSGQSLPRSREVEDGYKKILASNGQVLIQTSNRNYFADITGKITEPAFFSNILPLRTGFIVQQSGVYGWLNNDHELKVPLEFENIAILKTDFVIVKSNGKYGAYDINGKLVIPIVYDRITEGEWSKKPCACCYQGGKKVFYDLQGNCLSCAYKIGF